MFFGDASAARRFKGDSRIEVHGPGYSKVVIGKDRIDHWQDYIEIIATSVADNGGRSCVNASGLWVTGHAEAIAHALAKRLSQVVPRAADDEQALLAPFADAGVPGRVSAMIDADLAVAGAVDVTRAVPRRRAREDDGRRDVSAADGHPLRRARSTRWPTASSCSPSSASCPWTRDALPDAMGSSLVVTLISDNADAPGALRAIAARRPAEPRRRSRPTRSAGTSRTRATCSITCTAGARSSASRDADDVRQPRRHRDTEDARRLVLWGNACGRTFRIPRRLRASFVSLCLCG